MGCGKRLRHSDSGMYWRRYMKTSETIKEGFRKLLETVAYDKITITDICQAAPVSKKTFYKYFDDKPGLVEAVYYDDFVAPIYDLYRLLPLHNIKSSSILVFDRAFETLYDNRDIYLNLLENYGRMQFIDLIIRSHEPVTRETLQGLELSELDLDFLSYYIAANNAMIKVRWMESGFKESPATMARLSNKWTMPHFFDDTSDEGAPFADKAPS